MRFHGTPGQEPLLLTALLLVTVLPAAGFLLRVAESPANIAHADGSFSQQLLVTPRVECTLSESVRGRVRPGRDRETRQREGTAQGRCRRGWRGERK
eukprot:2166677-Rhodomonas_salina.2